jgi:hypothetical protein
MPVPLSSRGLPYLSPDAKFEVTGDVGISTAGFTIFPSFVASGTKKTYVECTKYVRITLLPFSDTQLTQENHGRS